METLNPPILYTFRRCPFAIRARLAIVYSNSSVQLREISLKNKPQSLIDVSAKATVPVLVLDSHIIDESLEIMMWALSQNDPDQWYFGLTAKLRSTIKTLITLIDDEFKPLLDNYKYASRLPEYTETEHRQFAEPYLEKLDVLLQRNGYLSSDKITMADVAIFPFIRQFAFVDKSWFDASTYKHLQNWLKNWLESCSFKVVMLKNQP